MGGSISYRNRFPLPDNWTVEDFICMVIPVPNDPQYIAMMRGLIDTLTWSRSFHLHPTEQAARQVADTWAAAFASREIMFKDCEDIDMSLLLRVKPGYPNISQCSSDGGETWVDFLIQPTWFGASGTSISWPVPIDADERSALAGGITAGTLTYFAHRVIEMDGDSLSRDQIQNNLEDEFRRFNALPEALNKIRPAIDAILDAPTPTVYDNDCTYVDFWTSLKDLMTANPNDFNQLLSNAFINYANDVGDSAVELVATIYYAFGGADNLYNMLANYDSLREPTFGEFCGDGCERLNLTDDQHGWGIVSAGRTFGGYTTGIGFYTINDGNANSPVMIMQTDMTGTPITHAEFYVVFTGPWTNLSIQLVDLNGGGSPSVDLVDMGGNVWAVDVAWTVTGNLRLVIQDLDNPNTGQAVVSQFCIV